MSCCKQCEGIEDHFDHKTAKKDLESYRMKGPPKTTQLLIDALQSEDIEGLSLLDIGGGVGMIQHEMVRAGVEQVFNVDASTAFLKVAQEVASERGYRDRATYQYGDFVDVAERIPQVDIVTLDKVICCYHDMQALVSTSAAKAAKLYGVVYPRDSWPLRIVMIIINFLQSLRRHPFRAFVHPTKEVNSLIEGVGLRQRSRRFAGIWQVVVYERMSA